MRRCLLLVAACAHAAPTHSARLADAPAVALGGVEQIAELGDAVYAFAPRQIAIVRGGTVVANVPAPILHWASATTIPALDGEGRWVVATDGDGTIYRVRATGELEALAQLGHGRVAAAATTIGVVDSDSLGVSTDGLHLDRYQQSGVLAVGLNRLALADATGVEIWDLAHNTRRRWPIAGVPAFLDAERAPRLVIAARDAVYVEQGDALDRLSVGSPSAIVAGGKLWVASASTLYAFDGAFLVPTSTPVPAGAKLFGARDGAIWIADGAHLTNHMLEARADDHGWSASIEPVFQRVCAHCHLPGGSADLDLSTATAWQAERGEIDRRVLVTRTMPPAGTELSDADRAAIAHWLR